MPVRIDNAQLAKTCDSRGVCRCRHTMLHNRPCGKLILLGCRPTHFGLSILSHEGRSVHDNGKDPKTWRGWIERLYHPDLMIEITAVAEIPRSRFRLP